MGNLHIGSIGQTPIEALVAALCVTERGARECEGAKARDRL